MAVFYLKSHDTKPGFEVVLRNPDGTVHDLTGSTTWKLHVQLPAGTFTRDLVKQGLDTAGTLRYLWTPEDWADHPSNVPPGLPVPYYKGGSIDLAMEYEVIGGSSRMTFPNSGQDTLRIKGDVG